MIGRFNINFGQLFGSIGGNLNCNYFLSWCKDRSTRLNTSLSCWHLGTRLNRFVSARERLELEPILCYLSNYAFLHIPLNSSKRSFNFAITIFVCRVYDGDKAHLTNDKLKINCLSIQLLLNLANLFILINNFFS
jgi:hypothetical protein